MDQDKTATGGKFTCGQYVVGLFDLLNQGKQLEEWGRHPHTPAEVSDFKGALKRTAGRVRDLRTAFKTFVEEYTRKGLEAHPLSALFTEEQNAQCQRLTEAKIGRQSFSDTVLLYSALAIPGGGTTVNGLHGMLVGSASVLLSWLGESIPLRGSIEVGMATDFLTDEIYGPVLRRAYLLEQKEAQYPRVVVGPEAIEYLRVCIAVPRGNVATEWNRVMAKQCLSLIDRDQDGAYFVDFLSDSVRKLCPDKSDYDELVMKGHAFAKRERQRFVKDGNDKLAARYALLTQYYESRM